MYVVSSITVMTTLICILQSLFPVKCVQGLASSGRARRDAAARAMQGWHSQRLLGNGEVSDPIIKVWLNCAGMIHILLNFVFTAK